MNKLLNLSTCRISFLLILVNVLVYGQVVGFEFVNFDHSFYVDNVHVKNGLTWKGLVWAFSPSNFAQYMTWISHMIDVELFGTNPVGHHATSLLLHIVNTVIFFLFMNKLTGSRNKSAVMAILFAIHPLRVETVAWVADRKDLLAMFFALLSLEAYRRFTLKPTFAHYGLIVLCFLSAMMSKPVMVILPFVFLLIDFWPLNRMNNWQAVRKLLIEKIPLFLILFGFVFMVVKGIEMRHMEGKTEAVPLQVRLAMMPVLYMKYFFHTIWPANLTMYYPSSREMPPFWQWGGSLLVVLGLTWGAVSRWRKHPYLVVGWFWFAGTMLPTIGVMRVGDHVMADRYTYFPLIGIFIFVVWGLAQWEVMKKGGGRVAAAAIAALLIVMIPVSFAQTSVWKNNFTLFQYAIDIDDTNFLAHNNLATTWMEAQHPEKAVPHLKESIRNCSHCVEPWLNLGMCYKAMQQWPAAIDAFEEVLNIYAKNVIAHEELGTLYHVTGDGPRAIRHSREAEAIYSEIFSPTFPKSVILRQNLKAYYQHYGISPKS